MLKVVGCDRTAYQYDSDFVKPYALCAQGRGGNDDGP